MIYPPTAATSTEARRAANRESTPREDMQQQQFREATLRHGAQQRGASEPEWPPNEEEHMTNLDDHGNSEWWTFRRNAPGLYVAEVDPRNTTGRRTTNMIPTRPAPQTPRANVATTEAVYDRLTDILQLMAHRESRPAYPRGTLPYTYSGKDDEDPAWFIQRIEEHLTRNFTLSDVESIMIIGEQLTVVAKRWYTDHTDLSESYQVFRKRFLDRFDSIEQRMEARAKLYGQYQKDQESAERFLMYKRRLFRRLEPQTSPETIFQSLTSQLKPAIRSRMRGLRFEDFEQFIKVASDIDEDIQQEERDQKKAATPVREVAEQPQRTSRPAATSASNTDLHTHAAIVVIGISTTSVHEIRTAI